MMYYYTLIMRFELTGIAYAPRRFFIMRSRNFGGLFLSAVLSIAGLLLLSSCGGNDKTEPIEMRGFFLSINEANTLDCGYENADVYLRGDESTGRLDVEIVSTSPTFPDSEFKYEGTKIIRGEGESMEKTIAASFVIESDDGSLFPGTLNVISRTDDEIGNGTTIFTGYWTGDTVRPAGNPIVMCPYVLVPREALDGNSCGEEVTQMAAGLRKYFADDTDNPTKLGNCYRQLTPEGRLSPMKFE